MFFLLKRTKKILLIYQSNSFDNSNNQGLSQRNIPVYPIIFFKKCYIQIQFIHLNALNNRRGKTYQPLLKIKKIKDNVCLSVQYHVCWIQQQAQPSALVLYARGQEGCFLASKEIFAVYYSHQLLLGSTERRKCQMFLTYNICWTTIITIN